jgi:hypothetical protein
MSKVGKIVFGRIGAWGRYYDHNFLQFLTIFGEKIGVFLKYHCYDQNFCIIYLFYGSKTQIFSPIFFGENILKSVTSVPGSP